MLKADSVVYVVVYLWCICYVGDSVLLAKSGDAADDCG